MLGRIRLYKPTCKRLTLLCFSQLVADICTDLSDLKQLVSETSLDDSFTVSDEMQSVRPVLRLFISLKNFNDLKALLSPGYGCVKHELMSCLIKISNRSYSLPLTYEIAVTFSMQPL